MGRLVIIDLNTNISGTFPGGQSVGIIYGLPRPLHAGTMSVFVSGNGIAFRMTITEAGGAGVLTIYLPGDTLRYSLSGQIAYISAE